MNKADKILSQAIVELKVLHVYELLALSKDDHFPESLVDLITHRVEADIIADIMVFCHQKKIAPLGTIFEKFLEHDSYNKHRFTEKIIDTFSLICAKHPSLFDESVITTLKQQHSERLQQKAQARHKKALEQELKTLRESASKHELSLPEPISLDSVISLNPEILDQKICVTRIEILVSNQTDRLFIRKILEKLVLRHTMSYTQILSSLCHIEVNLEGQHTTTCFERIAQLLTTTYINPSEATNLFCELFESSNGSSQHSTQLPEKFEQHHVNILMALLKNIERFEFQEMSKNVLHTICRYNIPRQLLQSVMNKIDKSALSQSWYEERYEHGRPVHVAARYCELPTFALACEMTGNLDVTAHYGENLLMAAAGSAVDALPKVKFLLAQPNPPSTLCQRRFHCETALHYAAGQKNADVALHLLEVSEDRSALFQAQTRKDETAIDWAIGKKDTAMIDAIVYQKAIKTVLIRILQTFKNEIGDFNRYQTFKCVLYFLRKYPEHVNKKYEEISLLYLATEYHNYYLVNYILNQTEYQVTAADTGLIQFFSVEDGTQRLFTQLLVKLRQLSDPTVLKLAEWTSSFHLEYASKWADAKVVSIPPMIHQEMKSLEECHMKDRTFPLVKDHQNGGYKTPNRNTALACLTIVGRPEYENTDQKRDKSVRRTYSFPISLVNFPEHFEEVNESSSTMNISDIFMQMFLANYPDDKIIQLGQAANLTLLYDHTEQAIFSELKSREQLNKLLTFLFSEGCRKVYSVVVEIFSKKYPCHHCLIATSVNQSETTKNLTFLDLLNSEIERFNQTSGKIIHSRKRSKITLFTRLSAIEPYETPKWKNKKSKDDHRPTRTVNLRYDATPKILVRDIDVCPFTENELIPTPELNYPNRFTLFISGSGTTELKPAQSTPVKRERDEEVHPETSDEPQKKTAKSEKPDSLNL